MSTFDLNSTLVVNDETSSSGESVYLPEGVYSFTINEIPKSGFHQPKNPGGVIPQGTSTRIVTLQVYHPDYPELKGTYNKTFYGHESTLRTIIDFFVSLGMVENKKGAQFAPDWNGTVGREGRIFIKRETYSKNTAKGGGTGYRNEPAYFKAPATPLTVFNFTPEDIQWPHSDITDQRFKQNEAPVAPMLQQAPTAPPVQQAPVQQPQQMQQAPVQQQVPMQQPIQQPVQQQVPPAPTAPPQGFQG